MFVITVGRIGMRGTRMGTLAPRELSIGRAAENDLILEDELVSRQHCRLLAIEGGAIVMDESSSNGTWLNGKPLAHPTLLTFNDELVIGPYVLRVQSLVGRCTGGRTHLDPGLRELAERKLREPTLNWAHVKLLSIREPRFLTRCRAPASGPSTY